MNFFNILTTGVTEATEAAQDAVTIQFNPANFITNLQYMGIGMLVIFVIIGIIILTTLMINKVFSK